MKTYFQELRAKKRFRTLAWNIFNAVIVAITAYFTEIPKEVTPIILIGLNMLTKYVNTTYFSDLGVTKPTI